MVSVLVLALVASVPGIVSASPEHETERLMLSGTGFGDTVDWEFSITGGRRAGEQTTIPVPSHWEQHGFGAYNYGHDDDKSREQGHYRHRFEVPAEWRGRAVDLVFEGVMTDAEARLNGQPAGPVHHGAFYRFRYDVSELLRFGDDNMLEVTVSKHSAEKSVNRAERDADYWVFGGIFRPVYLEARPPESIQHVAIDAGHDGALRAIVRPRGLTSAASVSARVETLTGEATGAPFSLGIGLEASEVELRGQLDGVKPWSAETPELYDLVIELKRAARLLHRHTERFGFRTVEKRADGLFINDRRVMLKGVNRHAFWPASGRTLNRELDVRDVELIKSMNMNAVRASHYPPDVSFLEACDALGLYVIDELAGWHDAYSTSVGRSLVREMVERDVNHPSVILWANGNEDGWNTALDDDFAIYDPQKRTVLHPRSTFNGFDVDHYPNWEELEASLEDSTLKNRWRALFGELPLVMPTELLHGLYDGGSGAGLEDYWRRLRASPRAAGAFLWSFTDEAIERTDLAGQLDTDGNHAPDGVLGPYRELSGNYYAVREIFSPIHLVTERFRGTIEIDNRFDMTDLSRCRFEWRLLDLPEPGGLGIETLAAGILPGPAVAPGERGSLRLPPEADWRAADALSLTASHRDTGHDLMSWVLPIREPRTALRPLAQAPGPPIEVEEKDGRLTLRSTSVKVEFDLATGRLLHLTRDPSDVLRFSGPILIDGQDPAPAEVRHRARDGAYGIDVQYPDQAASAHWLFLPSGWLRLSYSFGAEGARDFFGVRFDFAEEMLDGIRWLGDGPARVWKNRQRGGSLGLWQKAAGESTPVEAAHEPKLAGFYSDVVWAELIVDRGRLLIAFESPVPYFGLLSPAFPDDARDARATVPAAGVSWLHGISAIGTKFYPPEDLGPQSHQITADGRYRGVVWLRVRQPAD